jgi:hypothetical protein
MIQVYLKSKRAIRFLFYRHLSITEQLIISDTLIHHKLVNQYWLLNKADRHHSIEVMNRSKKISDDSDLMQLSLLHDIGKNTGHYSWFLRIFTELKIISSIKAKKYLNHELLGLKVLEKIDNIELLIELYEKELLKKRHHILEKTDY